MTNCSAKMPLPFPGIIFQGRKSSMHAWVMCIWIEIVADDDRAVRQWKEVMIQSEIAFNKTKCSCKEWVCLSPAGIARGRATPRRKSQVMRKRGRVAGRRTMMGEQLLSMSPRGTLSMQSLTLWFEVWWLGRKTRILLLYYVLCVANLFGKRFFQKFLTI